MSFTNSRVNGDEWMNGCMNEWMNEWTNEWMDRMCDRDVNLERITLHEWMHGCVDGWMNEWRKEGRGGNAWRKRGEWLKEGRKGGREEGRKEGSHQYLLAWVRWWYDRGNVWRAHSGSCRRYASRYAPRPCIPPPGHLTPGKCHGPVIAGGRKMLILVHRTSGWFRGDAGVLECPGHGKRVCGVQSRRRESVGSWAPTYTQTGWCHAPRPQVWAVSVCKDAGWYWPWRARLDTWAVWRTRDLDAGFRWLLRRSWRARRRLHPHLMLW